MTTIWKDRIVHELDARLAPLLQRKAACVSDMPRGAEAFLVWAVARASAATVLWIGDGPRTLQLMLRDLSALAPPRAARFLHFPSWEGTPGREPGPPDAETTGERLLALTGLSSQVPGTIVATCVQALMQYTVSPASLAAGSLTLSPGDERDWDEVARALESVGYEFVAEVQDRAQAARRGGIVDVWPPTEPWPLRLEWIGSAVESVRAFDPVEQRSAQTRDVARIAPAGEWSLLRRDPEHRATLLEHLPDDAIVFWSRDDDIRARAETQQATAPPSLRAGLTTTLDTLRALIGKRPAVREFFVGPTVEPTGPEQDLGFRPVVPAPAPGGGLLQPDLMEETRRRFLCDLACRAAAGADVHLFFDAAGGLERFQTADEAAPLAGVAHAAVGALSEGFFHDGLQLVVVAESELYGTRKIPRDRIAPRPAGAKAAGPVGPRVSDWSDIEPGDLVVHLQYGLGRYAGLQALVFDGRPQEVLAIEYADRARLYVPVSQAHLLTRYIGIGRRHRRLHRLGEKQWHREKASAERAIRDMASGMLEIQAARNSLPGHAYPPDSAWQSHFEAAFLYEETEDQDRAILEVKADMETVRPMDRLVCGDAGYGKTEVAMRAAFKAVVDGKQVAMLVPTTVLAQQHFYTFTERMAAYPIRIEMLSRFRSREASQAAVADLARGTVDIVIGTHSLLQPGIRFRDLGLVIIDEEQRFGVLHKETFKHMRRLVDVLTLTATPIPRTLYLSLTGARDLSTIQTPPRERLTIETVVAQNTDDVIRTAVLRELNRQGQVYYLHNRVRTIEAVRQRLQRIVPEARLQVAHGQMPSSELAAVMQRFAAGEFDLLLCTTIIESGLDIPNANTILIDRADRFGMADLYQLRGRVGRSKHKGYAYMLLPARAHVDPTARRRIQAVRQYADHGAGFRLAMRDLEIRGAGNLLGAEQSGHIAAVGFALYCQLLKRTIARLKDEPVPRIVDVDVRLDLIDLTPAAAAAPNSAVIPADYVADERLRIRLYRRLAESSSADDLRILREDFRDRFGPIPPALDRLLRIARLRIAAAERGLTCVEVAGDKLRIAGEGGRLVTTRLPSRPSKTAVEDHLEMLRHVIEAGEPQQSHHGSSSTR